MVKFFMEQTPLSFINKTLEGFEESFSKMLQENKIMPFPVNGKNAYIVFLSIGNEQIRAKVIKETAMNPTKLFNALRQKVTNLVRKGHLHPQWIKLDIVNEVKELPFRELEQEIAKTRRNYFRYGISFDPEWKLAFLEQEIQGNAMIRTINKQPLQLNEKNINHYLNYQHQSRFPFMTEHYRNKTVYRFKTNSMFIDKNEGISHTLYNGELTNGIRTVQDIHTETENLISKATNFLVELVKDNGKFVYGYFSAFGKKIGTYNILRHSSSLYSMCEGYEIVQDERIREAVERGIDYLIREAVVYKDEHTAFVVDYANNSEIKLGSNATAILAMTKYMEVTKTETYKEIAQALANGIIHMKLPDEGFIHVLSYPSYRIKDLNRIIYYEGEAIFALLRLYAFDKKEYWLDEVKKTFDYFIANDYWKHHDHWLSYAANELTIYAPEDKYFIFGLKNCNQRLNFIYHRETTYPTFLELTMAAYKMVGKIKELDKDELLEYIDEAFLIETIDRRAEYQRVGFFYPELAMYQKNPGLIINSFFIRHHSFRVRIDDVEHYLSGYCQYYHHRIPDREQLADPILNM